MSQVRQPLGDPLKHVKQLESQAIGYNYYLR